MVIFRLENHPTAIEQNYIGVGVKYAPIQLFVGQLLFSKTLVPDLLRGPYVPLLYSNNTAKVENVNSGSVGITNYVLKVPPNTKTPFTIELSNNILN